MARAFKNTCDVIFVNSGAPNGEPNKENYVGLSQVALPFKGALGKMGAEESMSVVNLDMQIMEDAEEFYRIRQDLGRQECHYGYSLTQIRGIKSELHPL